MTISATPKDTKRIAIDLRKKGYSYSEIRDFISIPKSTLGLWLKGLKLSPLQAERVRQKRILGSRRGAEKKRQKTFEVITKIQTDSEKELTTISKRELWLMGLLLYWKHKNKSDMQKGVSFMSSDPLLIRFFVMWLKQIGKLSDDDFLFDIFLFEKTEDARQNSISHWASILQTTKDKFSRIYLQKRKKQKHQKAHKSILKIRVKASSMLARQIAGWINGIGSNLEIS